MGYTMHEMNVMLFSNEDGVFAMDDGNDNSTNGEGIDYGDGGEGESVWGNGTNAASLDI